MACVGLNWAEQHDCVAAYVDGIFAGIWGGTLNPGSATDVAELLDALGAPDFAGYVQTGLESQQQAQDAAQALGLIGTPTYQVGDHLFVGREHLPLLRVWLGGTRAREGS
jgi:2-hydroxychromene-2-carboxylate isomerase